MDSYETFVISLEYPKNLLDKLKRDHNIDAILFRGIDGKGVSDEIVNKNFTSLYSSFGPKGSIGCALSHLNVWKTFLKRDKKYAIVFEDDIILENVKDLSKTIPFYTSKTPEDFDMLYLGSLGSEDTPNFFTIAMSLLNMCSKYKRINKDISRPQVSLATHAYIISRKGAKKLIQNLDGKIHNHIDYCIQKLYSCGVLDNYITTPRLLYQSSTNGVVSANVSNKYPVLVNKILSNFYLDKYVRASYITTVSVFRIGSINFTISTILVALFACIYLCVDKDVYFLFILIVMLSLPDFIQLHNNIQHNNIHNNTITHTTQ